MSLGYQISMVLPRNLRLRTAADWADWIMALETHARDRGVWDQIDPARTQKDGSPNAPTEPTPIKLKDVKEYIRTEFGMPDPDLQLQLRVHDALLKETQDERREYDAFVKRETEIRDWIAATVDTGVYQAALLMTASNTEETQQLLSIKEILQRLVKRLDCYQGYLKRQAQVEYMAVLEEMQRPNLDIEAWYTRWCKAYARGIKYAVSDVKDERGMDEFLQAVDRAQLDPTWHESTTDPDSKDKAPTTLPDLVTDLLGYRRYKRTSETLAEFHRLRDCPPEGESAVNDQGPYFCPCKRGNNKHSWSPETCAILEYAIRGACERRLAYKPSKKQSKEVRERLREDRWASLRRTLEAKGWEVEDRGNDASAGPSTQVFFDEDSDDLGFGTTRSS